MLIQIPKGRLREVRMNDLSALVRLSSDIEVQERYFGNRRTDIYAHWGEELEDNEKSFWTLPGKVKRDYRFIIEQNGESKGYFQFSVSNPPLVDMRRMIEISYFIGREYRRQGLAFLSIQKSLSVAFNDLNGEMVTAFCRESNVASIGALEKAGLKKQEGIRFTESEFIKYGFSFNDFEKMNSSKN